MIGRTIHFEPRHCAARDPNDPVVFGANRHFVYVDGEADALHGIAIGGANQQFMAIGHLTNFVPLYFKGVVSAQR